MLRTVVSAGTGRRSQLDYTNNVGKTGTSSAYRDAWFMGFTGQYVTGVWLGNDDFTPLARVRRGSSDPAIKANRAARQRLPRCRRSQAWLRQRTAIADRVRNQRRRPLRLRAACQRGARIILLFLSRRAIRSAI